VCQGNSYLAEYVPRSFLYIDKMGLFFACDESLTRLNNFQLKKKYKPWQALIFYLNFNRENNDCYKSSDTHSNVWLGKNVLQDVYY